MMPLLPRDARIPLIVLVLPLLAATWPAPPATPPATGPEAVHGPPSTPLDERIRPEKITESDLPPLPARLVLPMPATFRLAESADEVPVSADHFRRAQQAIDRGLVFLLAQQHASGGWMVEAEAAPTGEPEKPAPVSVAITALAMKAIAQAKPDLLTTPELRRAVAYVQRAQNADGSWEGGALTNYVTSAVVSALAAFERDEFAGSIQDGALWLKRNQWDQTEGLSPRQDWYGGAGYGSRGRPDLSNTQMMLEALHDAGMSPEEPTAQKALAFLSRAQNLKATNPSEWSGDDGGFIYTPANGGESMASEAAGEGRWGEKIPAGQPRSLRSYGSMTYAGFKSMIWSGMSPDDVRVRAAFDWIRRHFTFEENPGLGQQGLYYYYHVMSRALAASQQHVFDDAAGTPRNWREELIDALLKRQRDDGSWVNEEDRWLEGEPVMATIDAVLALEEALKPVLRLE